MARLAAAVITYSATTASSPRASSAARAAWAADPRMWRTCVAFASGWRYAAAAASPAALAACRAASVVASLAARWASAAAVRWRRERGAPSAKTRAACRAAAGRGSSGRAFWKRTSAGSAHATAYPEIARSSSIVNAKSPERVCISSSFAQRAGRFLGHVAEDVAVGAQRSPPGRAHGEGSTPTSDGPSVWELARQNHSVHQRAVADDCDLHPLPDRVGKQALLQRLSVAKRGAVDREDQLA